MGNKGGVKLTVRDDHIKHCQEIDFAGYTRASVIDATGKLAFRYLYFVRVTLRTTE